MYISIQYLPPFNLVTGRDFEQIAVKEGARIKDLVEIVVRNYGEDLARYIYSLDKDNAMGSPSVIFNINGLPASFDESLSDGDKVSILMLVLGG